AGVADEVRVPVVRRHVLDGADEVPVRVRDSQAGVGDDLVLTTGNDLVVRGRLEVGVRRGLVHRDVAPLDVRPRDVRAPVRRGQIAPRHSDGTGVAVVVGDG